MQMTLGMCVMLRREHCMFVQQILGIDTQQILYTHWAYMFREHWLERGNRSIVDFGQTLGMQDMSE